MQCVAVKRLRKDKVSYNWLLCPKCCNSITGCQVPKVALRGVQEHASHSPWNLQKSSHIIFMSLLYQALQDSVLIIDEIYLMIPMQACWLLFCSHSVICFLLN